MELCRWFGSIKCYDFDQTTYKITVQGLISNTKAYSFQFILCCFTLIKLLFDLKLDFFTHEVCKEMLLLLYLLL